MTDRICSVDECSQPHYGRGFCVKHYKADHHRRNADKRKAQRAAWRAANQDKIRATERARYLQDGERIRSRSAAYRAANPERSRAAVDAWKTANPERRKQLDQEASKRWHRNNPERAREKARRRDALKRGNTVGPVSYAEILCEYGMVCHICGGDIIDRSDLHFDHVIPLALGGKHSAENIRPSHARCNLQKGPRLLAG